MSIHDDHDENMAIEMAHRDPDMPKTVPATRREVNAYRDQVRAQHPDQSFDINSNGYGLHVRCRKCGSSATRWADSFLHEHNCAA